MGIHYKDSGFEWLGRIPETWEVDIAKHVFRQRRDKGNDECQLLAATQKYGMYPQHLLEGVVKVAADTDLSQFKTVHKNDYVISLRSFQGGFEMSDYEGVCSPAYQVFYATRQISSQYYKYLFKSEAFIQEINSLTVGIREGKNILYDDFALLPIPIPSTSDQQRIADYLDEKCGEIDSLIGLQEQMIEKLKAYKQSVITEAVTKGLNPNAKLVPSGIDWIEDIPEGWKVKPFKALFRTGKGLSFTKADLVKEGLPVISYGQVHSKQNNGTSICDELIRFIPFEIANGGESSKVDVGDFIFADTSEDLSGCGNCVYVDKEIGLYAGYHSVVAISKRKVSNRYLAYLFLTDNWRSQIRCRVTGIKVFSISQSIINQTSVILPPDGEQQTISTFLDGKCSEIEKLIEMKQQKIEKLKDYKKSVIYEAVTGKINIES